MDFEKLMNVASKNERKAQKEVCCYSPVFLKRARPEFIGFALKTDPAKFNIANTV